MSVLSSIPRNKVALIQKVALKNNGTITAKQYREILKSNVKKSKQPVENNFSFTLAVEQKTANVYLFTLYGRHLSTNSINAMSRKDHIRYKNAIKKAFEEWYMINTKKRPKSPFKSAVLIPIHYNKVSRDDDSGVETNKIMRDCIVRTGFVQDDTRKHIMQKKTREVLQKEYKVEMLLLKKNPTKVRGITMK